jgi:hypothetical protein
MRPDASDNMKSETNPQPHFGLSSVLFAARLLLAFSISAAAFTPVRAAVRYVNANSASPASPYTTWATAATTIQDAADVAVDGDELLVTKGVYRTGGRVIDGILMNRLAVTNAVLVRSVNGPEVTVIEGSRALIPDGIRCAFLTNGAALVGFTLTNGSAAYIFYSNGLPTLAQLGGGVWCSPTVVVSNCIITGNNSSGAVGGTLNNCLLAGNSAWRRGGGASYASLNNCTLTGNSLSDDGSGG